MDPVVIEQKLESLRRCVSRIEEKCPDTAEVLAQDIDLQDIVSLNLSRAIQLCVDIGAHLVSTENVSPPATMGQTFDVLTDIGVINADLASRMKRAVGFRNIAVHNYEAINWAIVHKIATSQLDDFRVFVQAIMQKAER